MDSSVTARRVLAKAAVHAGGVARLAERIGVGAKVLGEYITGARPVPDALFLAAIDVVLSAAGRGDIAPGEAQSLIAILEARLKAIDSIELDARLRALEARR